MRTVISTVISASTRALGIAALISLGVVAILAQTAKTAEPGASRVRSSSRGPGANDPVEPVVREIHDPFTGDRWVLVRDPNCPGGPGRMVLAERAICVGGKQFEGYAYCARIGPARAVEFPVIHSGDRLIVEEHSRVVEARFAAVALGNAPAGAQLKVRLAIGGKVVRAVALAAGEAVLVMEEERQR